MTIKQEIREKVIEMAQQNKGRNRIAHELGIGQGTVSAILKKWRETSSNPAPATIPTPQSEGSVCIDACQQHEAICQNHVPTNPNSTSIQRPKPRNGNPLSHLIVEDYLTEDKDNPEINLNPSQTKTKNLEVNINNNGKCLHYQDETIEEEKQYQRRALLSNIKNPSRRSENNRGKEDQDQEENIDLGIYWTSLPPKRHQNIDWNFSSPQDSDLDVSSESNFLARIMQEKELRHQEMEWILAEQQELQQMREWLEEQRAVLKSREAKVAEIESLAPSVKHLQRMGVDFSLMQSYILLVNERSVLGNIDTRQAALFLSHEFKQLKNLGGILKKIQEAKQELSRFGEQEQKALTVLMSLMDKGITESQIALLATDCWHQRQYQQLGNIQQSSDNNGYGGDNYTMTDYLRLNLLKGSTTNMLNKMTPR